MADVNDRGQLILVTALAIAVLLVGLVLLLNTVIYAENLATRGADIGGQDAVEYRQTVITGVGGTIDSENSVGYDSSTAVRENVSSAVGRLDELLAQKHIKRTELVEVSNVSLTDGTVLLQPTDTNGFNSSAASGSMTDWPLASSVESTRGFVMTIDGSDVTGTTRSNGFQVIVDDGTNQWKLYVYDDGGLTIDAKNGTETPNTVCTPTGPNVTIDVTGGTVDGEPCPGIVFAKGVATPYTISFANGDTAGGTYSLTLKGDPTTHSNVQANFNGPQSGLAPRYGYAVYDATVDVRYQTNVIRYTDTVRIAPGESA